MLRSHGGRPPHPLRSRRAAVSVSAAALVVAAPALTACGGTPHPGAAAVVDGKRITVSQLQGQVSEVRDAQRDSPRSEQLIAGTGRLSQDTLIRLIQQRVVQRAAEQNHVTVTRREVGQARSATTDQAGGAAKLRELYLQQGIAPNQIDNAVRMELLRAKLLRKLGTSGVNNQFMKTSEALGIDVNPRYGDWNDQQGTATLGQEPWVRQVTVTQGEQPA